MVAVVVAVVVLVTAFTGLSLLRAHQRRTRAFQEARRRAPDVLSPARPLSDEELARHVPAHLRRPEATCRHYAQTFQSALLARAATLAWLVETSLVETEAGGFTGAQEVTDSASTLVGWYQGERLRLVEVDGRLDDEAFVVLYEPGSDRYALLNRLGGLPPPGPAGAVRSAARRP